MGTNHYQRFYNYGRKWFITSLVGVTIGLNVMLSPISVAASDQVSKSTYPASSPQIAPQEAASRPPRLDYWDHLLVRSPHHQPIRTIIFGEISTITIIGITIAMQRLAYGTLTSPAIC